MFATAAGRRLEVLRIEGDPPPLVFLHEGLGSVAMWRGFPAAAAARTGCAAVAYSRWGHGASEPLPSPRGAAFMHDEALRVLPELLDVLGIGEPVLAGHSDGASIALIHAGAARRPVRGLVLLAPHVFVEELTISSIARMRDLYAATDLRERLARYHDDADGAFRGWNDVWLDPAFRAWNIEDVLPSIGCPVLVIQGEDDEYGTAAQVEAVAGGVSGPVTTMLLPGCGHSPHRDRPGDVLDAIARFVQEVRAPRSA
jgi:pimeloyl-ACP methyl ester carboxylesterase